VPLWLRLFGVWFSASDIVNRLLGAARAKKTRDLRRPVIMAIVVRFLTCYYEKMCKDSTSKDCDHFWTDCLLHRELEAAMYPVMCPLHCSYISYSVYLPMCYLS
jgi:hypothetical protein